jgi:GTP cyclohydrolase I
MDIVIQIDYKLLFGKKKGISNMDFKLKAGQNIVLSKERKEEMMKNAEEAYGKFLEALGYDWKNDPNMVKTPYRVAKMMVNEITSGVYEERPRIATFPGTGYTGMVTEMGIEVNSLCSHHFLPFCGICHISYIPQEGGDVVGLSKLNRIVHWFAKRPQLQEQLTKQIHDYLKEVFGDSVRGIAVYIEAEHMCVSMRGAEDNSSMVTNYCSGLFLDNSMNSRDEFLRQIQIWKINHK